MSAVYSYLSALVIVTALVIGAFLYGHHEGSLVGTAKLNATIAAVNAAAAQSQAAAVKQQQANDAALLASQQVATQSAEQAASDAQSKLSTAESALRSIYASQPKSKAWATVSVPAAVAALLNSSVQPGAGSPYPNHHH